MYIEKKIISNKCTKLYTRLVIVEYAEEKCQLTGFGLISHKGRLKITFLFSYIVAIAFDPRSP